MVLPLSCRVMRLLAEFEPRCSIYFFCNVVLLVKHLKKKKRRWQDRPYFSPCFW